MKKISLILISVLVLSCFSCRDLMNGVFRNTHEGVPTLIGNSNNDGESTNAGNWNGTSLFWNNSRIIVSNAQPLFLASIYKTNWSHHSQSYDQATKSDVTNPANFEAGMTPEVLWNAIPDSLKPYTAFKIHYNDEGEGGSTVDTVKDFYDKCLTWCDANKVPALIVICAVGTSGTHKFNQIDPTDETHKAWVDSMVEKHPSLKGFITAEHWWNGAQSGAATVNRHADWINYCAEKDKTLISFDGAGHTTNWFNNDRDTSDKLSTAALAYGNDHWIRCFKSTRGYWYTHTSSYMLGSWMAGISHAYGGLLDTWNWNSRSLGVNMTDQRQKGLNGTGYPNIAQYPGGWLASELMLMYMNGGTVFNFEAPWHVQGNSGRTGDLLANTIAPFFEWMVKNPAPTEQDMRNDTRYWWRGVQNDLEAVYNALNIVTHSLDSSGGQGAAEMGNNSQSNVFSDGRYGIIPALDRDLFSSDEEMEKHLRSLGGFASNDDVISSGTGSLDEWNSITDGYYEDILVDNVKGKDKTVAFAGMRNLNGNDTYFFYNHNMFPGSDGDSADIQYARIPLGNDFQTNIENNTCNATKFLEIALTPHTMVIAKKISNNSFHIYMNNSRIDTSNSVGNCGNISARDAWFSENICINGVNTEANLQKWNRDTKFWFDGCTNVITNFIRGQNAPYPVLKVTKESGSQLLTVTSNGWLEFTVDF
ncbi:MAG: hypothetical protein IKW26_00345 [Treponema sp.]|nr:hypothetical protein [Treponema sp.]